MPDAKTNRAGFPKEDYQGSATTLCKGCGHNSITNHLIKALYEFGIDPHKLAKMSGIGCSSKTTNYFANRSHGFNAVHGRMPALALGAKMASSELKLVGVSGDGDTASIGLGHFMHMVRRNLDILYLIENNGVYGLTKGQFSATANVGSKLKDGTVNVMSEIDCCAMAIQLEASYVARSFSGDGKQLVPLIKGALAQRGTALIDVISPCVTFNDHDGSTMSYDYMKEHEEALHTIDYIEPQPEVTVDYAAGETRAVPLPNGGILTLKKVGKDYDPSDKIAALARIEESRRQGVHLTGLLYVNPKRPDFTRLMNLVDEPLYSLGLERIRPSRAALAEVMAEFA
ncbi:MAG: 2-oxoacid:ferredoxin oxidoreductase subunit beta [Planctomycetes bacterium]|nr:2-oxoacid:ferredoxin oxidoreductase subunit beta [Planctomycetota bacterium]